MAASRSPASRARESAVASLAWRGKDGTVLWLANLTGKPVSVRVKGFAGPARLTMLDEGSFARATTDPGYLAKSRQAGVQSGFGRRCGPMVSPGVAAQAK